MRSHALVLVTLTALLSGACGQDGATTQAPVAPSSAGTVPATSAVALVDGIVGDLLAGASEEQERLIRAEADAAIVGDVPVD